MFKRLTFYFTFKSFNKYKKTYLSYKKYDRTYVSFLNNWNIENIHSNTILTLNFEYFQIERNN